MPSSTRPLDSGTVFDHLGMHQAPQPRAAELPLSQLEVDEFLPPQPKPPSSHRLGLKPRSSFQPEAPRSFRPSLEPLCSLRPSLEPLSSLSPILEPQGSFHSSLEPPSAHRPSFQRPAFERPSFQSQFLGVLEDVRKNEWYHWIPEVILHIMNTFFVLIYQFQNLTFLT